MQHAATSPDNTTVARSIVEKDISNIPFGGAQPARPVYTTLHVKVIQAQVVETKAPVRSLGAEHPVARIS